MQGLKKEDQAKAPKKTVTKSEIAKPKKTTKTRAVDAEVTWTAGKMAEACSVTTRRLGQLAEEGVMKKVSHGRYAVIPSLLAWNKQLREQVRHNEEIDEELSIYDDVQHIDVERAKHEHLKIKLTEIKLELLEGKVHKAEDVERVVTDMLLKMKSKLQAIPSQIAPRIEGKKKAEIEELLNIEIEKALMELSEYNADDFRSDDYIEVSDEEAKAVLEDGKKDD